MASLFAALRKPSVTNQPPSAWETRRNDLTIILWFALMLFLGLNLRSCTLNASQSLALGKALPTIHYPAGWSVTKSDQLALQAKNLASPSPFDAEIDIFMRDLKDQETLDLARSAWSIRRGDDRLQYRELAAENVQLNGDTPGLLVTYAYIADPSRESGANGLPVVVQAQDLIFTQAQKMIVVTTAADANEWAEDAPYFQIVHDSLKVQPVASDAQPKGGQP